MPIKELSIDIETYCEIDLRKSGVYRYAEDDSFELLLIAVSVDNGPVTVYDLTKEKFPQDILEALVNDSVIKWAFNAQFERLMTEHVLGIKVPPSSWRCTMVLSYMLGFSGDLAMIGRLIGLDESKLKDPVGDKLINPN